ncbi:MAG: threonine ammonia-lyase, biosynthetic [Acidobacteria bacterium]|nr:MAG: threonine ammonia-lyase, biosynthetic [Acidobacteriota bacterium]REK11323.1 MAG: threonine ammonia-lyase, biosynthetic [Acidobacteriota bacterium]
MLQRILRARVYDLAVRTELQRAEGLSQRFARPIHLKREDQQPVFSFKLRGAFHRMQQLDEAERRAGVICSSAGNHAQGVALAAGRLGLRAVVVMPSTTPEIKVDAVRALGGEVVLHGSTYDDAQGEARRLQQEQGLVFVHPFDDLDVIAGQGTIAVEIAAQLSVPAEKVFVPIGGGGLIAGIASYLAAVYPETEVVGVEPEDAASMTAALRAGQPVTLDSVGIFADGVAVRRVGDITFSICRDLGLRTVLVSTDEICAAIQDIYEETRTLVEPAGALALAGLKREIADVRRARPEPGGEADDQAEASPRPWVAVNCGANVNFDRLRHIAERAALGEQREILLGVQIPERPGSFRTFCRAIGERHVTEFNYRMSHPETARIFVGLELHAAARLPEGAERDARRLAERRAIVEALEGQGYRVQDLSDNEMAKLHLRHLIGGPAPGIAHERLLRFEFPERRGALLQFLEAIGSRWNISLFHYRNHGSDYGRVLCGVQVPPDTGDALRRHLDSLGYAWSDESDNPAYALFLAADLGAPSVPTR